MGLLLCVCRLFKYYVPSTIAKKKKTKGGEVSEHFAQLYAWLYS
jgi:hypothetical protein